mgnify:CR=1 FL=1
MHNVSLVVMRLAPSPACGALPEIRQNGPLKPGETRGTTTDPPTLAAQNFLTIPPLTKLKYVRNALRKLCNFGHGVRSSAFYPP